MELADSASAAAAAAAADAAASPPTLPLPTAAVGSSPLSPGRPSTPLTDTHLLQLSLRKAAAAVAAGKATIAANNYALVVKTFFRKCFLLEELVLLALAMGNGARTSTQDEKPEQNDGVDRTSSRPQQRQPQPPADGDPEKVSEDAQAPDCDAEQPVDPLANVGMLLPPGLDEDDYDEERHYYDQKRQREDELAHRHPLSGQHPLHPPSDSPASLPGLSSKGASGKAAATPMDDAPGYDAATAQWLACLLAKVHPDALPIATLEKLCKVPIPPRAARWLAAGSSFTAASFGSPVSAAHNAGDHSNCNFPSASAAAPAMNVITPCSPIPMARLIPHLKTSPLASPVGGNNVASPAKSTAATTITPTTSQSDATAASSAPSSSSLSLLFATLLWDVACALWNEGFIEDTHHWLSVMDVRRLWKLYGDACTSATAAESPVNASIFNSPDATSCSAGSALFSSLEPSDEGPKSDERACALSWAAVLAECRAADEPTSAAPSRSTPPRRCPTLPTSSPNCNSLEASRREGEAREKKVVDDLPSASSQRPAPTGITLPAFSSTHVPLPMTRPTTGVNDVSVWTGTHKEADEQRAAKTDARRSEMGEGAAAATAKHTRGRDHPATYSAQLKLQGAVLQCEGAEEDTAGSSGSSTTVPNTASLSVTTALQAIPRFIRRLARRTSALRDLCGIMMGCETSEDVFYIIYAFHCALQTQQRKMCQQQPTPNAATAAHLSEPPPQQGTEAHPSSASVVAPMAAAATGGLAETLIVANLLVEFFLSKRAQKILLDAGVLPAHLPPVIVGDEHNTAAASASGAPTPPPHAPSGEHKFRVDRAVRQACDEIVCTFTNGQCLTLYGLESYGILSAHDGGRGREGGKGAQLLAPELPFVLVTNVLSSAMNFATLYRLSKVFHGVMGVCGGNVAAWRGSAGSSSSSAMDPACQCSTCQPTPAAAHQQAGFPTHVNRTRKATDEERLRRQRWTRVPPPARPTAAAPQPTTASEPQGPAHGVVGDLFGFVKGVATSWRSVSSATSSASAEPEPRRVTPVRGTISPRPVPPLHHDVWPSQIEAEMSDAHPLSSAHPRGGYAERLAEARREHAAKVAVAGRSDESTPPSERSPSAVDGNNSALAGACSSSQSSNPNAKAATQHAPAIARREAMLEVRTRGPGACELLVPSHSAGRKRNPSTSASAAAAAAAGTSTLPINLLTEENERVGPAGWAPTTTGVASAADTVLHAPSVKLQSRSPSEAVCLRLLTILYRYPLLHTLEPVTASHVDLVAKELNKALHILQVAMKDRFGEQWWRQWRARREDETQEYYARALADAQRGGHVPSASSKTAAVIPNFNGKSSKSLSMSWSSVGLFLAFNSTQPSAAAAAAAVASVSAEPARPPSAVGTTSAAPNPSLVLRPPSDESMRLPPPFALHNELLTSQPPQQQQLLQDVFATSCDNAVPPPSAPQPTPRQGPILSDFWSTRTLSIPTQEGMRERRQNLRERSTEPLTSAEDVPTPRAVRSPAAARTPAIAATETAVLDDDGALIDVGWDVPPAYTPEVSLDFSAFTTTSVETQEATRRLAETLQRQQHDADVARANADVPGVSLLSCACRRLLHNELPLLQQYCPWRVIYSTRMHGVSLATLFSNCKRESERHVRMPIELFSSPLSAEATSSGAPSADARPMLLVLELPASATLQFSEDDAGVHEVMAERQKPLTMERANAAAAAPATADYRSPMLFNKLYIGAYLSDLLRLDTRRYYGSQDCFVFQLLVPAEKEGERGSHPEATPAAPPPQLRIFRATRQNTQFINCRSTSIVIGGGGAGSSLYLDESLCHGATSTCATFNSPPLCTWASAAATLCDVAGVRQPERAAAATAATNGQQQSLFVVNVEVIVMDT
ncbi:TLD domain protein conserved [Leptomonas seymouri]|uniref:TLD domain protein conserved n=1 Tax=Leptomonas seymouri TaxID=5684 RepID=A0A0N1IGG7_LEPSE|nr:TLD domain protein conserved [Leptomonas seymouri]|eukprot:KPI82924.1 TLD domain protein conserved [Leptomonas seymouri]